MFIYKPSFILDQQYAKKTGSSATTRIMEDQGYTSLICLHLPR